MEPSALNLLDKSVFIEVIRAAVVRLKRMGCGEIQRVGSARNESGFVGRDGDGIGAIDVASAKIGGVRKDRVDHQRAGRIVGPQLERDTALAPQDVIRCNCLLAPVCFLVSDRLFQTYFPAFDARNQFAVSIDAQLFRPFDRESDGSRIRSRPNNKIVLKLSLRPVVNEIDAAIDFSFRDPAIIRDIHMPVCGLVADEIVALSRQFVERGKTLGAVFAPTSCIRTSPVA